jgi:hypothetical protein
VCSVSSPWQGQAWAVAGAHTAFARSVVLLLLTCTLLVVAYAELRRLGWAWFARRRRQAEPDAHLAVSSEDFVDMYPGGRQRLSAVVKELIPVCLVGGDR